MKARTMPSYKAMHILSRIMADVFYLADFNKAKSAEIIDGALAEARLEGARAMQVAAENANFAHTDKEWVRDSLWDNMAKRFASSIRAIDPQQVINESMGK